MGIFDSFSSFFKNCYCFSVRLNYNIKDFLAKRYLHYIEQIINEQMMTNCQGSKELNSISINMLWSPRKKFDLGK